VLKSVCKPVLNKERMARIKECIPARIKEFIRARVKERMQARITECMQARIKECIRATCNYGMCDVEFERSLVLTFLFITKLHMQ
jgi:hypothetical protein